ncbi:hypothetical protein FB451DRAFT_1395546 [Mycena latifolia]|nr:hypothetical protein FB451DRAFT_1395546 [Mycena latifolia]
MDMRKIRQQERVSRAVTRIRRRHRPDDPDPQRERSAEAAPVHERTPARPRRDSLPLATETRKQTQAAEDAKNWQPSDSWLAMAADIALWTNAWRLGASHDVTTTTSATEDVHEGASHDVRDSDTIFEEAARTSGEPRERRWSAPPPMITTPAARAVADAIAAAAETTDDPTLVMESDKLWDHVLKVCMDGMRESQRRTWLIQLDEQERLMHGPPSGYLSGRRKRLIPDGESARKKRREWLAEVAAGVGVGSDDEGWVDYSATQYIDL